MVPGPRNAEKLLKITVSALLGLVTQKFKIAKVVRRSPLANFEAASFPRHRPGQPAGRKNRKRSMDFYLFWPFVWGFL